MCDYEAELRSLAERERLAAARNANTASSAPEDRLAALMRADLGTTCSPRELRMFIKANWRAVTAYAHAIHDADKAA